MRRRLAVFASTLLIAAATASAAGLGGGGSGAGREKSATFLIPASEGYGVADCLTGGHDCGKVVAGAWCEAQGYARAERFGVSAAEDVTGSVERPSPTPRAERPIAITCAD